MKQGPIIIAIVVFSILAIIFLNASINGFVISQSCCFGSQCSAENICEAARSPVQYSSTYPELFIGLVSIAMIASFQFLRSRKE